MEVNTSRNYHNINTKMFIVGCKANMVDEFEMKYIGMMHYSLGLEVWQRP
jgi:hypothetical protein